MTLIRFPTSQIYGPVPSRRLGRSLGVDIVPPKTCSFNCIYCQAGLTTHLSSTPARYYDVAEVVSAVLEHLADSPRPDYVSFSGMGEPTLNLNLGPIARRLKAETGLPVAVLTNSSLVYREEVAENLLAADTILPSLDAGSPEVFRRLNRPHPDLVFETVITGLQRFAKVYPGRVLLEVMLVRGINDDSREIGRIIKIAKSINPDTVQLNTVVRPPLESWAAPLELESLLSIKERFLAAGVPCEVIKELKVGEKSGRHPASSERVLDLLRRRPCTIDDIAFSLDLQPGEAESTISTLLEKGLIHRLVKDGKVYYGTGENR